MAPIFFQASSSPKVQSTEDAYLTETQVSQLLSIAVQTLRNWRFQGSGPAYVKVNGRAVRYRLGDITSFMNAARIVPRKGKGGAA